jgi:hypothetical protein
MPINGRIAFITLLTYKCLGEMQSPLEASVQELCNARLVEEFAHMDQNGPPIPPSDFLLWSASGRTSSAINPPPELCRSNPAEGPSVAVHYRNEGEVREGFLIALHVMGVEQHREPAKPPVKGGKP